MSVPPPIAGILETAVYVDDLDAAYRFYNGVLGLERMSGGDRLHAYNVAPGEALLVFQRGRTLDDSPTKGGVIPGHHSDGPSHFSFKISTDQLAPWRRHFAACGLALLSEVTWPGGGVSLYIKDTDGNIVELAAPPLWPNFQGDTP